MILRNTAGLCARLSIVARGDDCAGQRQLAIGTDDDTGAGEICTGKRAQDRNDSLRRVEPWSSWLLLLYRIDLAAEKVAVRKKMRLQHQRDAILPTQIEWTVGGEV